MYHLRIELFRLAAEQGENVSVELVTASEEVKLKDEEVLNNVTTKLGNKVTSSLSTTTSGNDVINNNNLLARLDRIGLHLKGVLAVFLLVNGADGLTGDLTLLADGDESGTKLQSKGGAKEEASGIKTNDDVDLALANAELKTIDQQLEGLGVLEDGEDILKQNSLGREIGVLAELATENGLDFLKVGHYSVFFFVGMYSNR